MAQSTPTDKKGFLYSKKQETQICYEKPAADNPYLTEKRYLFGYDHEQLCNQVSYVEQLYLLIKGELPNVEQSKLLNYIMSALLNLGPREPCIAGSMTAAISKCRTEHILPIGLQLAGGEHNGAITVAQCTHFLQQHKFTAVQPVVDIIKTGISQQNSSQNFGFGQSFGDVDPIFQRHFAQLLHLLPHNEFLLWCDKLRLALQAENLGLLPTSFAAIGLTCLEIGSREALGLYQLMVAPGILMHGLEQTHKPITSAPLLEDEQYYYEAKK
ncbi:hypothetical protein [Catenovulum sediminis]|uniref:Citrate synthase n=1 Tax=Catenovulum sediminis TaxID=1740262 RepID=A0ABV1RG14_9ALTE|nr:hypothetical protein [Catenovulum sediminis]